MPPELIDALTGHYGEPQRTNMTRLSPGDVVIPTFAGAGKSILAVVLRELGLDYVDALKDRLRCDGSHEAEPGSADYRNRLGTAAPSAVTAAGPRFLKVNLPIDTFVRRPLHGLWILVRDPRDSLYSTYRLAADVLSDNFGTDLDSFAEWLTSGYFAGLTPIEAWAAVYSGWPECTTDHSRVAVTRFEDLKRTPRDALSTALAAFGVEVSPTRLDEALDLSSFDRMRSREEAVLRSSGRLGSPGRMVRRGRIDEWKEWMTPELRRLFADDALVGVASRYGYDITSGPA